MQERTMIVGAIIVSVTIVVGFFFLMALIVLHQGVWDDFQKESIKTALTILGVSGLGAVVGFWIGSSSGSMMKSSQIATMDKQP